MKKNATPAGSSRIIPSEEFLLELYVTGASPNSVRAISNLRSICQNYLSGRYSLKIIDVYQSPTLASQVQLIALPMLIRKRPLPERKVIGDLSQTQKVLKGLGIES